MAADPGNRRKGPFRPTITLWEVTNRLPLSASTHQFVEWLNRQGLDRNATEAIGPQALLLFLAAWCKTYPDRLTPLINEHFSATGRELVSQALASLVAEPSVSAFPYITSETREVLQEAQELVKQLHRGEINPHHIFAALLIRAAKSGNPDRFLAFPRIGFAEELQRSFLDHVRDAGYGEAWDNWEEAFGMPRGVREYQPRNLTTDETAEIKAVLGPLKVKLTYAVEDAITLAAMDTVGFADKNRIGFFGIGNLFLGFLEVAWRDERKDYASMSLPIALRDALHFSEADLRGTKAAYRERQTGPEREKRKTGIIWLPTFLKVLRTAIEIQQTCSPNPNDSWIAARHLIAAMLQVHAKGKDARLELDQIGFYPLPIAKSLYEHLKHYAKKDDSIAWSKFFDNLPSDYQPAEKSSLRAGKKMNVRREATGDELCLNIHAYAQAIADTFTSAAREDDFVFALYAPWGRGKSTMINEVSKILGGDTKTKRSGRGYRTIFFSAWKYPTRPEIWVHLYQTLAEAAQEGGFWQHARISFRVGLLKHGWWPLFIGFGLLAISRIYLEIGEWFFNGLGFIGVLILASFFWNASKLGKQVAHSYFSMPDHATKLGLQAIIGQDLKDLLNVWTNPPRHASEEPSPSEAKATEKARAYDFSWWRGKGLWSFVAVVLLIWITLLFVFLKVHTHVPTQKQAKTAIPITLTPVHISEVKENSMTPVELNWSAESTGTVLPVGSKRSPIIADEKFNDVGFINSTSGPVKVSMDLEWNGRRIHLSGSRDVSKTTSFSGDEPANSSSSWGWLKSPWFWMQFFLAALAGSTLDLARRLAQAPDQCQRILLVVDDLDRCEPDQMLAVIESLRLFLDESAMSRRMQVAMLLDRNIFQRAMVKRGKRCGTLANADPASISKFFREQEEKLFIASLQLAPISTDELQELAGKIVDAEYQEQLRLKPASEEMEKKTGAPATRELAKDEESSSEAESDNTKALGQSEPNQSDFKKENAGPQEEDLADVTFHNDERPLLKEILAKLNPEEITPRGLRAFTLRYQLIRLVLHQLNRKPDPFEVMSGLAHHLYPTPGQPEPQLSPMVKTVIEMVAGTNEKPLSEMKE
jgi:KAP family P-loop domain